MLYKVIFIILTAMVLTLGGVATGMAVPHADCGGAPGACQADTGGSGTGGGNFHDPRQGGAKGNGGETCSKGDGKPGLSSAEIDSLLFMREEEKVARDSYLVLDNLWGPLVFRSISDSEQKHMDAIKVLLTCYGLTDPVIDEVGSFSNPDLQALFDYLMGEGLKSGLDALHVGALIEETDIVDIQASIDLALHEDIISTYESLMYGSRNHLRTFIRQIESNGGSYTPQVLDPDVFWAIAYSAIEPDCGSY